MKKVLSVQVPAPCPLACAFCRTPNHNEGDPQKVLQATKDHIGEYEEIYITSNGETGLSPIFIPILTLARENHVRVAVLCATEHSIVPGLYRAEISLNQFTIKLAVGAIEKAKQLNIPTVISMIDTEAPLYPETVARQYGVDGVLIRALQAEGRSRRKAGTTRWFSCIEATLGHFPVEAYREIGKRGVATTCINHHGNIVPYLGGE